jgi:hypothetical protein
MTDKLTDGRDYHNEIKAERDRYKEALDNALVAFKEIDWSNSMGWRSLRARAAIAAIQEALRD